MLLTYKEPFSPTANETKTETTQHNYNTHFDTFQSL